MLQDFANVTITADAGKIAAVWLHHYSSLTGTRGIFCVKEQRYDKPELPENRDFGGRGFLRSWMASKRLLLIQNCERERDRRDNARIFCDSNFVSTARHSVDSAISARIRTHSDGPSNTCSRGRRE